MRDHYGPGDVHKTGHAHVATEQPTPEDEDQQNDSTPDDDEEGIFEIDLSGLPAEQAEPILLAARQAGLRVRAPFKRPSGGNRFQPRPKSKFQPRVPTPPRTGERVEMWQLWRRPWQPRLPQPSLGRKQAQMF